MNRLSIVRLRFENRLVAARRGLAKLAYSRGDLQMRTHVLPLALAVSLMLAASAGALTNERGLDRRNLDTKVSPCVDFYRFANGGWLDSNPIPPEYSRWGSGTELMERNLSLLKQILE